MSEVKEILRSCNLRPTKQRLMIGQLLFDGIDKHVTAEYLYRELKNDDQKISLATVYNILHDFSKNKLLKKVTIDPEKVYFDTNTEPHHHFYSDNEKLLVDISKDKVLIERLPKAPKGKSISNVELIIHLEDK